MKVLIACESSGLVREAFKNLGHDAYSIDLTDSEISSEYHIIGNALDHITADYDLLIAFPPCTHLAVSGARWFEEKDSFSGNSDSDQAYAVKFFMSFANAPIKHICIENPISIMSSKWRKPDQIIQPWMFGHGEVKATCLWLKNLPELVPTNIVEGREDRVHRLSPNADRAKERSRTYQGVANAMASQWSNIMDIEVDPKYLENRIFVNFNKEIREVIGDWEIEGQPYYKLRPTASSSGGATVPMSDAEIVDVDASLIIPVESMTDDELEQALSDAENERLIVSDRKQAQATKRKKAAKAIIPTTKEFQDKMNALLDL